MVVYLDVCCLQRPWDDHSSPRIALEAEAVLALLELCASGRFDIVSSAAIELKVNCNPHPVRRKMVRNAMALAKRRIWMSSEVEALGDQLASAGFRYLDAMHVAYAAHAKADFFCTCDDRLLRKLRTIQLPIPRVVSPMELLQELEP